MYTKFQCSFLNKTRFLSSFAAQTVAVAQLVRASDCGSEGRGFEPHQSPCKNPETYTRFGIFF